MKKNYDEILYNNDTDSFMAFKIGQITQFATIIIQHIEKKSSKKIFFYVVLW